MKSQISWLFCRDIVGTSWDILHTRPGKHIKSSYWKWPFSSLIYPLKIAICHSYVGLPEGNVKVIWSNSKWRTGPMNWRDSHPTPWLNLGGHLHSSAGGHARTRICWRPKQKASQLASNISDSTNKWMFQSIGLSGSKNHRQFRQVLRKVFLSIPGKSDSTYLPLGPSVHVRLTTYGVIQALKAYFLVHLGSVVDHPSSYLIRWIAAQLEGRPVHLSQQQSVDSQIQVAKPSKVPHYGNPRSR